MNDNVLSPVVEGIKDSLRLSAGLVLAVGSVFSSFSHHSLSLRKIGDAPSDAAKKNPEAAPHP